MTYKRKIRKTASSSNTDLVSQAAPLNVSNSNQMAQMDQNSWKTLISFLEKKEIAKLCQSASNINEFIQKTPYAVINRRITTSPSAMKSTITYHQASVLTRRANELKILLNPYSEEVLRRIANSTPYSQQKLYSSLLLFIFKAKRNLRGIANLTPNTYQDGVVFIILAALGIYASSCLNSSCSTMAYNLIGGNIIGDVVGATLCTLPAGIIGMATGMYLGQKTSQLLKTFSEHGGMCIGGFTGGVIGLSGGIYYGLEKMVTYFPPREIARTITDNPLITLGGTALTMFSIYANKAFFSKSVIEAKTIQADLNRLKRF